jgi:hypothetical protein
MNAERLNAILSSLNQEMNKNSVVSKMNDVIVNLEAMINNPHPSYQQNLAKALKTMYSSLSNSVCDSFSPTWRQILNEIGGEELFGDLLRQNIEEIFARNQITPAVALEELKLLYKQLSTFEKALKDGTSGLNHFNIGDETLSPGECEIGVLIPRKVVGNKLLDFAKELEEIGFILNTFSEVVTGNKDDLSIRTISSSDLMVYLNAALPYAACLAVAVERTIALYRQLLEIRKLHDEIHKQGVPENDTIGIEKYANKLIGTGIEKLTNEIVDDYYKAKDAGRKNELKNAIRISLNKLANRIDQGFNIEIRVQPLKQNEQEDKIDDGTIKAIEQIQNSSMNLQFLKLEGQPILKLSENLTEKSHSKEKKDKN